MPLRGGASHFICFLLKTHLALCDRASQLRSDLPNDYGLDAVLDMNRRSKDVRLSNQKKNPNHNCIQCSVLLPNCVLLYLLAINRICLEVKTKRFLKCSCPLSVIIVCHVFFTSYSVACRVGLLRSLNEIDTRGHTCVDLSGQSTVLS